MNQHNQYNPNHPSNPNNPNGPNDLNNPSNPALEEASQMMRQAANDAANRRISGLPPLPPPAPPPVQPPGFVRGPAQSQGPGQQLQQNSGFYSAPRTGGVPQQGQQGNQGQQAPQQAPGRLDYTRGYVDMSQHAPQSPPAPQVPGPGGVGQQGQQRNQGQQVQQQAPRQWDIGGFTGMNQNSPTPQQPHRPVPPIPVTPVGGVQPGQQANQPGGNPPTGNQPAPANRSGSYDRRLDSPTSSRVPSPPHPGSPPGGPPGPPGPPGPGNPPGQPNLAGPQPPFNNAQHQQILQHVESLIDQSQQRCLGTRTVLQQYPQQNPQHLPAYVNLATQADTLQQQGYDHIKAHTDDVERRYEAQALYATETRRIARDHQTQANQAQTPENAARLQVLATSARQTAVAATALARTYETAYNECLEATRRIENRQMQQKNYDYFYHYRRQTFIEGFHNNDSNRAEWVAVPVPIKPGDVSTWPGTQHTDFRVPFHELPRPAGPNKERELTGGPVNFDYARDTVNQVHIDRNLAVARGLRAVTGELKFIKLLGWGGQGMAMLYYVRGPPTENEPNGELKYYVVKSTLVDREHQENVLMDELRVTQEFEGAEHIIQATFSPNERGVRDVVGFRDLFITEYLRRGTLDKAIFNATEHRRRINDRTLWLTLKCLYRGLVAMRYPPKRWRPNPPRGHERMPRHDEFDFNNPPGPPGQGEHRFTTDDPQSWVHFDLDPTNVLVGEYDDTHVPVPRLKAHVLFTLVCIRHLLTPTQISDFGCASDAKQLEASNRRGKFRQHWVRRTGKRGYLAPEQFTSEWDYISSDIVPDRARIAGKYSWKTNLWHVGCIMWSMITHKYLPRGPVPEEVDMTRLAPVDNPPIATRWAPGRPGRTRRRPGVPFGPPIRPVTKWTYGNYVCRDSDGIFREADPELRTLVMRFMMDDPADRPEMEEIEEIIERKLNQRWRRDTRQARNLFETPPAHRERTAAAMADFLADRIPNVNLRYSLP